MEEININLVQLLKLNLTINEYLTLYKLKLLGENISLPFSSTETCLKSLVDKGFLEVDGNGLKFSGKGLKVFKDAGVAVSKKDFEEFYLLYPMKTPGGRKLRSGVSIGNKTTRDFDLCYQKYLKSVKSLSEHDNVIQATKNCLMDYRRRGASEFLQNIETFINQRTWEKYADMSPIDILGENVERL